jgi:hypothetical protein
MFDLFNVTNLISSFVLQLELATKLIKAVINFSTKQTGEKIQIWFGLVSPINSRYYIRTAKKC